MVGWAVPNTHGASGDAKNAGIGIPLDSDPPTWYAHYMKCSRCQRIIAPQHSPIRRLVGERTWTFCGKKCSDDHAAGLAAPRKRPAKPKSQRPLTFVQPKNPPDRGCIDCGEVKPYDEFYNQNRRCNPCTHTYNQPHSKALRLKERQLRKYGLTFEQADEILESQGGVCAICRRDRKLVVDHDHGTDEIRGFLCLNCNTGIGMLGDNIAGLEAAIAYLRASDDTPTLRN